ncbi:MAG: lysylphosphatidylglycerol synthase domain-containing protein [Desulfonatronovibrionaceae bacterium]
MLKVKKFCFALLQYLPFIAILFVFIKYYGYRELSLPQIESWPFFLCSLLSLFFVFFMRSVIWMYVLLICGLRINLKLAFVSKNIALLMKYIPGKVWAHAGTAGFLWKKGFAPDRVFLLSLFTQILTIISGLLAGCFGMFFLDKNILEWEKSIFILLPLAVVFAVIYLCRNKLLEKMGPFWALFRSFSIFRLVFIFVFYFVHWLVLGFSYLLLFNSLGFSLSGAVIFLQPLANNIGMLAMFVPSGMGVREGMMALYLDQLGLGLAIGTYLAIISRIWFLLVEVILFFVSWILELQSRLGSGAIARR